MEIYDRIYTVNSGNNQTTYTSDDFEFSMFSCEANYIVYADGGMGKSFMAKHWSDKYERTYIEARDIIDNWDLLQSEILIDNFDEININDSDSIIKRIISNDLKGIFIFCRPENNFLKSNYNFTEIKFEISGGFNPRARVDYKISELSLEELNRFYKGKITAIVEEFLSLFAFSGLVNGEIGMKRYEFFEFLRKFNVHNNSHITIEPLIEIKILKENMNWVSFANKSLASYFSFYTIEKLNIVKNSYLSNFSDLEHQISFTELGRMIDKHTQNLKFVWSLISSNLFIHMFYQTPIRDNGLQIEKYLEYGALNETKDNFTNIFSRMQLKISNDVNSYYILEVNPQYFTVFEKLDHCQYIDNIWFGSSHLKRKKILNEFLLWTIRTIILHNAIDKLITIKEYIGKYKKEWVKDDSTLSEHDYVLANEFVFGLHDSKILENKEFLPNWYHIVVLIILNNTSSLIDLIKSVQSNNVDLFVYSLDDNITSTISLFMEFNWKTMNIEGVLLKLLIFLKNLPNIVEKTINEFDNDDWSIFLKNADDFDFNIEIDENLYHKSFENLDAENKMYFRDIFIKKSENVKYESNKTLIADSNKLYNDLITLNVQQYHKNDIDFLNGYRNFEYEFADKIKFTKHQINEIFHKCEQSFKNESADTHHRKTLLLKIAQTYGIIFRIMEINISEVHPLALLYLTSADGRQFGKNWTINQKYGDIEKAIVNYFKKIENINIIATYNGIHLIWQYIQKIFDSYSEPDQNCIINLLSNFDRENGEFYHFCVDNSSNKFAANYIKEFNWKPKNILEFLTESYNMYVYLYVNKDNTENIIKTIKSAMGKVKSHFLGKIKIPLYRKCII